jgi:Protein of unknown function (DUF4242)
MPHYLLELYLPRDRAVDPDELAGGAKRAAEQGVGVSYLRSMVLPDEELCFHVFGAPSAASVAEAGSRLDMPFERVIEVLEVNAADREDL